MAKKKAKFNYKFSYDAPVAITFALITVILFLVDTLLLKGKLNATILRTPTMAGTEGAFNFKEPLCYLQLLLHVFGGVNKALLFSNMIFIILLGMDMEVRYGSVVIGIMIFVSALVSGVLSACFCKIPVSGAQPVIFMLIILDILIHLTKKTISASAVAVICLFVAYQVFADNANGAVGILITLAGGLSGSLFAFMASPKARAVKKQQKTEDRIAEIDAASPRFANKKAKKEKKSKEADSGSDETIVGTIEL